VLHDPRPALLHIIVGPALTAIGLNANYGVQVITRYRKRIDRNRKTPCQQSEPIFNPFSAMIEVTLGMRGVRRKARRGDRSAIRNGNASGGG